MEKILTPIKAIRKYCVSVCMLDHPKEVSLCTCIDNCPLYPYRNGHRPKADTIKAILQRDKH